MIMKKIALIALCLGFFMVIMDVTIINVALPTMALYLHATVSGLQWIVDGYTLTFAASLQVTWGIDMGRNPGFNGESSALC